MNIISETATIKDALKLLNELFVNLTLFVVNENEKMIATLTDGDIRRGLLSGSTLDDTIGRVMNRNFEFVHVQHINSEKLKELRTKKIFQVPVLDHEKRIVKILDLEKIKSYINVDALIMAGGEGQRLRPLTLDTPKPLLHVGGKPIIEHNIDRLVAHGVTDFSISLKYLAEKIESYLGDGTAKHASFKYIIETSPMGTIGALKLIEKFNNPNVLVMNSDLLTNIDFEDFYNFFQYSGADMAVATTAYNVNVPYAVLELDNYIVKSLKEKPTYTYYSNAGIYLLKREVIDLMPESSSFDATDLMELVMSSGLKLVNYPILGYWLDIGNHSDFRKAQEDIKHIQL